MESYNSLPENRSWRRMVELWLWCFIALCLLTISFPHQLLPLPAALLKRSFDWLARFTGTHLFGMHNTERSVSDGAGMQVHYFNMLLLALPLASLLHCLLSRRYSLLLREWMMIAVRYFLAWQLLLYGFNKIFKCQFYLPEPNIQYTELHQLGKDMLYWTVMGASRSYSVFMGSVELIAALLLFWRRTALIGSLLAAGILLNVCMVNIAFDISVKLYAAFLLLLSVVIVYPYRGRLRILLASENLRASSLMTFPLPRFTRLIKAGVILLLLADALYPYLRSGNFNDDAVPRPPLHGAYNIQSRRPIPWKRFFIHRRGYFILQDSNNAFRDFELNTDTAARALWISRTADTSEIALYYTWLPDSSLQLNGWIGKDSIDLQGTRLPLNGGRWGER